MEKITTKFNGVKITTFYKYRKLKKRWLIFTIFEIKPKFKRVVFHFEMKRKPNIFHLLALHINSIQNPKSSC